MKRMILGCAALMLVGCSTSPIKDGAGVSVPAERLFSHQEGSGSPTLVVTRDTGILGSGCKIGLYVDGRIAATFKAGERAFFYLDPGQHLLGVGKDPHGAGLCALGGMALREHAFNVPETAFRHWRISTDLNSGAEIAPTSQ